MNDYLEHLDDCGNGNPYDSEAFDSWQCADFVDHEFDDGELKRSRLDDEELDDCEF